MSSLVRPMTSADAAGSSASAAPADALEWRYNPWRERPWMAALAALLCLACVVFLLQLGLRAAVAVVLGIALSGALSPLLLPARCRVDREGVAYRRVLAWERRAWSTIGRAKRVRGGLLVSPFRTPQPLDTFRALLLPMPRVGRDALFEKLAPRLAEHDL